MKVVSFIYKTSLLVAILTAGKVQAQVGPTIALPSKSASLDLTTSQKKGLLLPRVNLQSLTDKATIANGQPATGLWLYNTNKALPDTSGFYTWTGSTWAVMSGDNLGNHKATQGLGLVGNTVSNDGSATKGLVFDNTGNATFAQQLTVKSFGAVMASDNILSANSAGLIEKVTTTGSAFVTADAFARKASFTLNNIASGDSSTITANTMRTPTYMVVVTTSNGCGRVGIGVFMVSNNTVSFMGGQARSSYYTVTVVAGYNGSRVRLDTSMPSCTDGNNAGGNAFGFTIMILPGNNIRVINSGSLGFQTYSVTVKET